MPGQTAARRVAQNPTDAARRTAAADCRRDIAVSDDFSSWNFRYGAINFVAEGSTRRIGGNLHRPPCSHIPAGRGQEGARKGRPYNDDRRRATMPRPGQRPGNGRATHPDNDGRRRATMPRPGQPIPTTTADVGQRCPDPGNPSRQRRPTLGNDAPTRATHPDNDGRRSRQRRPTLGNDAPTRATHPFCRGVPCGRPLALPHLENRHRRIEQRRRPRDLRRRPRRARLAQEGAHKGRPYKTGLSPAARGQDRVIAGGPRAYSVLTGAADVLLYYPTRFSASHALDSPSPTKRGCGGCFTVERRRPLRLELAAQ